MSQFYFLKHDDLDRMFSYFSGQGYEVMAPAVRDKTIVYDNINNASELPWGYVDIQEPAKHEVLKTDVKKAFGWSVPVQSVKPMLFEEKKTLWKVSRDESGKLTFNQSLNNKKYTVRGVRPCDLRAIEIQDRVFVENAYPAVKKLLEIKGV